MYLVETLGHREMLILLLPFTVLLFILIGKVHKMALNLDRLSADISAQSEVIASVSSLIEQLAGEIRSCSDDPAALEALASKLEANTQSLSEAVAANTMADAEAADGDSGVGLEAPEASEAPEAPAAPPEAEGEVAASDEGMPEAPQPGGAPDEPASGAQAPDDDGA